MRRRKTKEGESKKIINSIFSPLRKVGIPLWEAGKGTRERKIKKKEAGWTKITFTRKWLSRMKALTDRNTTFAVFYHEKNVQSVEKA